MPRFLGAVLIVLLAVIAALFGPKLGWLTLAYLAFGVVSAALYWFDKRAAREALAKVDATKCGATKDGHAKVTFAVDGTVSKVDVDWPSDLAPATRECVKTEFAKARILAFDGQPITLGTSWRASRSR